MILNQHQMLSQPDLFRLADVDLRFGSAARLLMNQGEYVSGDCWRLLPGKQAASQPSGQLWLISFSSLLVISEHLLPSL